MLGQLLHSFNPSRRGSVRQPSNLLESVTEDSHTRNLLFPDATALFQSDAHAFPLAAGCPAGSAYDGTQAGIDLDQARDFRVIIAQDEAGAMSRAVLFDSKPTSGSADSPAATSERRASRTFGPAGGVPAQASGPSGSPAYTPGHGRRSSLAAQASAPQSPTVGAFQRARTRGASISSMPHIEEGAQGRSKESEELVKTCLECMFGTTPMAYRGPSNKIHIIPMEPRPSTAGPVEGFNSLGRAEGRKRSGLATSYTPSNFPPEPPQSSSGLTESSSREPRRRTILITRLFSVSPPDEVEMPGSNSTTPTPKAPSETFPFSQGNSSRPSRQSRTPMYAIGIIIHLPISSSRSGPGAQRTGNRAQGGQDSLGSSFDSDRRAGWAFVDSTFGVDSLLSTSGNSDVDDRVDVIGQHWDVISRTLTSLQFVIQEKIMSLFKDADAQSQQPSRTSSTRSGNREPIMPPRRMLKLQAHALLFDPDVKQAVETGAERVVRGMKVPRVVTGQGRWGVWREEARWLGRWAGGREQNFFLFNLLTAFLGTHTEWLNVLGPRSYRAKHREQQKSNAGEDITISSRTIIISPDKMAARRLIFLLANFLPASTHAVSDGASPGSASIRGYSQSPPSNATISRQQSLRRTISRKGHKSYPNMSVLNIARGNNVESLEDKGDDGGDVPPSRSAPHLRRPSSIRSINSKSLTVPAMAEDPASRKGSVTTTSTATSDTTVPVAHFAVQRTNSGSGTSSEPRPSSSGSLASVNLRQNLRRTGSNTASSPSNDSQASRWGSFMSFWSGGVRRESSTDPSDILQSTDDGLGVHGPGYRRPYDHSATRLEQMVQELSDFDQEDSEDYDMPTAARAIPSRSSHFDSPLKLSINESDGVIDVDISLPGFGSPLQSPLLPTLGNSVSSLDGSTFGPSCYSSAVSFDSQPPVNVAGWLARFHQDFALQGVQPYAELENDIKKAMSAEPTPVTAVATPTLESGPMEKWVHICTALIADARTFTIKRLHLKRKVRLIPTPNQPGITPHMQTPGSGALPRSQYGNPYSGDNRTPALPMTELHLEQQFVEEPVMDLDETLVDALERGLAQSSCSSSLASSTIINQPTQRSQQESQQPPQPPSRPQIQTQQPTPTSVSASSSRSSSCRGRGPPARLQQDASDAASTITSLEVPRQECKALVLGALEQVVRSVAAERTGGFGGGAKGTGIIGAAGKEGDNKGGTTGSSGRSGRRETRHKESTLREGVRRWLAQVEDGAA